tara:strand:- start:1333 stop:1779 length:447 start_codon:yes stop_codon:yes gene_type:complete
MADPILGRSTEFKVARNGATLAAIAKLTDFSFSLNAGEIDTTTFDDAGLRSYVKGNRDVTMDISFIFDTGDAAQKDVIQSWSNTSGADASTANAGGILDFQVKVDGSNTFMEGKCFVTSISYSTGEEEVQRVDASLRVDTVTTYDFVV